MPLQFGAGQRAQADFLGQRHVALHLAVNLQIGQALLYQRQRRAHFVRGGRVATAEAGVRQHGDLGNNAEATDLFRRQYRGFGDLLGAGVEGDVGVANKYRALGQQQRVHRGILIYSRALADHMIDIAQMPSVLAEYAA